MAQAWEYSAVIQVITQTPLAQDIVALETAVNKRLKTSDNRDFESLLSPVFYEFGASGKVWSRDAITTMLASAPMADGVMTDVRVTQLANSNLLVTYRWQSSTITLRSSIWCYVDGVWQMIFHQGTVVPYAL